MKTFLFIRDFEEAKSRTQYSQKTAAKIIAQTLFLSNRKSSLPHKE